MVRIEVFELWKGRQQVGAGQEQYRIQTIALDKPDNCKTVCSRLVKHEFINFKGERILITSKNTKGFVR